MTLLLAQSQTQAAGESTDIYLIMGFILLAVAACLFALEVFVPSGGLLGLLCGVAMVGSVVAFFMYSQTFGAAALMGYLILLPLGIVTAFKMWTSSSFARRLILGGDDPNWEKNTEEATFASERARHERLAEMRALIGAEGVAVTALRPIGVVKIQNRRLDAMAEGSMIEKDMPVKVTDVYDNQVKVKAV